MKILFVNDHLEHAGTENLIKIMRDWLENIGWQTFIWSPLESGGLPNVGNFDIVHINNACAVEPKMLREIKASGTPLLMTMHDYWPVCRNRLYLLRDVGLCHNKPLRGYDCKTSCVNRRIALKSNKDIYEIFRDVQIITISNYQNKLMRDCGFDKVKTILNGIPPIDPLEVELKPDHHNYVVWSGRAKSLEKGLMYYIKLSKMIDKGIKAKMTITMTDERKDYPTIENLGYLTKEDYMSTLKSALAFVQTPLWPEPCGLTQIESQMLYVPIVSFDVGGISDYVTDGKTGFLIKPYDLVAMSEKIDTLANDEYLRAILGRGARKRAERDFTVERMMKEYKEIYEGL